MNAIIEARGFGVSYGGSAVLRGVDLAIRRNKITAIIGPAGSGKTTFLRCINRLSDLAPGLGVTGGLSLDGRDVYATETDVADLRRRAGMVFAVPIPLPRSVYENVVFGPKLLGVRSRAKLDEIVERTLRAAVLWEEVKDRLNVSGLKLSGGQQQRLCLARTLALEPQVLLLDEPCSGLDPISTAKIEEAMQDLKSSLTVVLVTNNVKQAARASDRTAFFLMGELVEEGPTADIFTSPRDSRTNDYIVGRFG
ncbi:MAG: phosphate ABC transporter ATP-binding protein [Planctomycetes bacterium]|nr:phosphate ABC transporter ATP-binding protein [Planctomycetota bacterium]